MAPSAEEAAPEAVSSVVAEDEEKAAIRELMSIHPITRSQITSQLPMEEWKSMSGVEKLAFVKARMNDDSVKESMQKHCDEHNISDPHNIPQDNTLQNLLDAQEVEPGKCPWTAMMEGSNSKPEAAAGAGDDDDAPRCPMTGKKGACPMGHNGSAVGAMAAGGKHKAGKHAEECALQ
mmetsp:Transcript_24291/g.61413  ORF Transcript_24291/g.61413 Transcript_24291/m.61413 type:complete len:177 (-) Transcript_24291:281-811(-)